MERYSLGKEAEQLITSFSSNDKVIKAKQEKARHRFNKRVAELNQKIADTYGKVQKKAKGDLGRTKFNFNKELSRIEEQHNNIFAQQKESLINRIVSEASSDWCSGFIACKLEQLSCDSCGQQTEDPLNRICSKHHIECYDCVGAGRNCIYCKQPKRPELWERGLELAQRIAFLRGIKAEVEEKEEDLDSQKENRIVEAIDQKYKKNIEKLEFNLNKNQLRIEGTNNLIDQKEKKLSELKSEVQKENMQVNHLKLQIEQLKIENRQLEKKNNTLNPDFSIRTKQRKLEELNKEVKDKIEELNNLNRRFDSKKREFEAENNKVREIDSKIFEKQRKLESYQTYLNQAKSSAEQRNQKGKKDDCVCF